MSGRIWPSVVRCALGLMSGTSLDGIDAAIVETDGQTTTGFGPWTTVPYDDALRERLRRALGARESADEAARDLTLAHAAAVAVLLRRAKLTPGQVDVVGFHGHTVDHRPAQGVTWQIGDGALLARLAGIDVVGDFRSADVAAGGEGAPLVPLFHRALCASFELPVAVLNIGGIANLTWIGPGGDLLAWDTGPGNALLDDWTRRCTGQPYDRDGALAAAGTPDAEIVEEWLRRPFFARPPPKSCDRLDFDLAPIAHLGAADGAATLAAFTCAAIAQSLDHMPGSPKRWLVSGGGRRNRTIMAGIQAGLAAPVEPVERAGWNGDALEAQAFAYLAVRSLDGLPLSLPSTTGVARPTTGGTLFRRPA